MNKIANNFLLAGHMFKPELHVRQQGFIDSPCRTFTKYHERVQKLKETDDSNNIYEN